MVGNNAQEPSHAPDPEVSSPTPTKPVESQNFNIFKHITDNKTLYLIGLSTITVFCIILVFFMVGSLKEAESDFNDHKAAFIKKNMDLEEQVISTNEETAQTKKTLALLEEKSKAMVKQHAGEIEALKEKNITLAAEARESEKKPLADLIQENIAKEEDENVKKLLEKTLRNLELAKSGENIEDVALESANLASNKKAQEKPEASPEDLRQARMQKTAAELSKTKTTEIPQSNFLVAGKRGKILSVDKRYNLMVISLGRRDDVTEGEECIVLKNGKEAAFATIISARYKVSAAFLDETKYGYDIRRIKEGDEILVME
ncbi:MAG: hypothetical protein HQ549_00860 [Candidatus Omnitrophica bacterium]|nr:hypothetical protein [Candidatus Omnitrophota bacterium]